MKYYSHKVVVGGTTYDSKKEYYRWIELLGREKKGEIQDLRRQVRFEILPRLTRTEYKQLKTKVKLVTRTDEKPKFYTADFVYKEDGWTTLEDVKSKVTMAIRDYPLRRHLIKMWCYQHTTDDERYRFIETI